MMMIHNLHAWIRARLKSVLPSEKYKQYLQKDWKHDRFGKDKGRLQLLLTICHPEGNVLFEFPDDAKRESFIFYCISNNIEYHSLDVKINE